MLVNQLEQIIMTMESDTISWAKDWMEEGMKKGMEKGVLQGRSEGVSIGRRDEALSIMLRLLNRRFGQVSCELRTGLESLPHEDLEQCIDVALDSNSSSDLWRILEKK